MGWGKMQNINMKDKSFKLVTADGKSMELKAPSILNLPPAKAGDSGSHLAVAFEGSPFNMLIFCSVKSAMDASFSLWYGVHSG
jgi:hypothetical protein